MNNKSNVAGRFPRESFLAALHEFNTARGPQRRTTFQAVLKEVRFPEEARLLFVWTGAHGEFHREVLRHWKKKMLDYARLAEDRGLPWKVLRHFYSISPSGSLAEELFGRLWVNHPEIQAWLAKPAGHGVVCATPIS